MNKKWWLIVTLGLVLVLATPILSGCGSPVTAETSSTTQVNQQASSASLAAAQGATSTVQFNQQPQGIWVSGAGEISITPDIATLNLGVEAQETNVAQAQSEASAGMAKVMQALSDSGIAPKDIQTGYFNISQRTNWDNLKQINTPIGYQVDNIVTVTVRDTGKVGSIIDTVVQAAGDLIRINGVNFSVENPAQYYQQARDKAMTAAKSKADELAKLAGLTLSGPTYIVENAQYTPYYGSYMNFSAAVPAPALETVSPSISAGQTKITLSVQVAYSVIQ